MGSSGMKFRPLASLVLLANTTYNIGAGDYLGLGAGATVKYCSIRHRTHRPRFYAGINTNPHSLTCKRHRLCATVRKYGSQDALFEWMLNRTRIREILPLHEASYCSGISVIDIANQCQPLIHRGWLHQSPRA